MLVLQQRHQSMGAVQRRQIVVSADVQPMAQERVRALGAIAFLPKPVTPEALRPVLKEYGLHA